MPDQNSVQILGPIPDFIIILSMSQMLANQPMVDPVLIDPQTTQEASNCLPLGQASSDFPVFAKVVPASERDSNEGSSLSPKTEPQTSQFKPLDLIEQAKEDMTFKSTSTEQALVLCDGQVQIRISLALLQGIEFSFLPTKIVVTIKTMAKEYWEAHRSCESNCLDEEKAILFAYLLVAIYELKELSLEELKDDKERMLCQLTEDDLKKYATKLNEKILEQVSQNPTISWKQLLQDIAHVDSSPMRRKVLLQDGILEMDEILKEKDLNQDLEKKVEESLPQAPEQSATNNEAIQAVQDTRPSKECEEGIPETQQPQNRQDNQEEKVRLIASLSKQGCSGLRDPLGVEERNESVLGSVNDEKVDFDDLSVVTEGKVTEIDISLPLCQFNDDLQKLDCQTETENVQNV